MSALAKPGIYFAGATQSTQLVPAEYIKNMSKLDISASPLNGNTAEYKIVFTSTVPYSPPIVLSWGSDQTGRDASFTNAKTTLGASIANS